MKPKLNIAHLHLERDLAELGLAFEREFRFHALRRWRLDYFLPDSNIGIEIDGGITGSYDQFGRWTKAQGRHNRPTGYQKDLDKLNHATIQGIRVLRFSTDDVLRNRARCFLAERLQKTK